MTDARLARFRAEVFDQALLTLLYEHDFVDDEGLMNAVLDEARNALSRLSERGLLEHDDEGDE
jgi:hypothetical protein